MPEDLMKDITVHSIMMQVSGEGEAKGSHMMKLISGLGSGTKWEGTINPAYVWRKARSSNPAIINPFKVKDDEDRSVDWLTFCNINDWTDQAKRVLIDMNMVKDEPGEISKSPVSIHALSNSFLSL